MCGVSLVCNSHLGGGEGGGGDGEGGGGFGGEGLWKQRSIGVADGNSKIHVKCVRICVNTSMCFGCWAP